MKCNRSADGDMGTVDIDVQGVTEGCSLHQFHFIPGEATQFQQLDGEDIPGEFLDNPPFSTF